MSTLTLCFSVELNTHPNMQFPAHFVVHTPLCLHVLFRVARPLHSFFFWLRPRLSVCTACALRAHCVHIVHAEARILTQEYLSPVY